MNPSTRLVTDSSDLRQEWLVGAKKIGICGATSTPAWLMKEVAERVSELVKK